MNQGGNPKASKSKLHADRPDHSYYFNPLIDGGNMASSCTVMGLKVLTTPGVADSYTFLLNTQNTLPESYQWRVYNNTFDTVMYQVEQAENQTPAGVIRVQ
jgi:hypothetical protein